MPNYEDGDEDTPICYDCHTRVSREKAIHDYYYKPTPLFRGDGPRYFGVELEIDSAARMMTMRSRSCERPERPVTLRSFKVMRFEYKKAPHSNRVRCLELVG